MTFSQRTVTVRQLPADWTEQRLFTNELGQLMNVSRPCLVLDCSTIRSIDRSTALLLLTCLEEAMKRNGDVRLARLSPEARAILELTGVAGLFRTFELCSDAVNSFHQLPSDSGLNGDQLSGPAKTP